MRRSRSSKDLLRRRLQVEDQQRPQQQRRGGTQPRETRRRILTLLQTGHLILLGQEAKGEQLLQRRRH